MIMDMLYSKPLKKQVEILEYALGAMQMANWKSQADCIAEGMGFDSVDRDVYSRKKIELTPT